MKILAGTLITNGNEVHLLKRRESLGCFDDMNALRCHLAKLAYIPDGDWSDFRRGSLSVQRLMPAAVLTAGDYGTPLPEDTGVIGWNGDGCTAENLRFWQDYIQNGRQNGRGGLFVATLPTIPYCEAAITLGCKGSAAYFRTKASTSALFRLLKARPAGFYLIGEIAAEQVCMLLLETGGSHPLPPDCPSLSSLFALLEKDL